MAQGGTYRIDNEEFPAPVAGWEEQPIAAGLDAMPIQTSYRVHTWRWRTLDGYYAEKLFAAYDGQQSTRTPPGVVETDPYDGTGAELTYGTTEYIDVVIRSLSTRERGLPHYNNLEITFEIYVE